MFPILLNLGPISVRTYGVLVAAAFLVSLRVATWLGRLQRISEPFILDLAAVLIVSGLFGARALYVLLNVSYFSKNLLEIVKVWEGGLVFYGGFLAAAAAGVLFTKRRRMDVARMADVVAPALAFGQAVGRWGCFFAGCCYGKPTSFFCAVQFKNPAALAPLGIGLHPTQIYESLGDLAIGLFLSWRLIRKPAPAGTVFWLYALLYGILRFFVEMVRGDDRGSLFGGLFPSQWIALIAVILSGSILITQVASQHDAHA
jgi:phosphatidylglycerol---prolipoprotein diacylglyceryl transferase